MGRAVRAVSAAAVLLLTFALSGWTPGFGGTSPRPEDPGVVVADAGSDLGNGRPQVTHDGLMVRRRVVIAILPTSVAHLASLHKDLLSAATHRHISLTSISPTVLDPVVLERFTPREALLLPAGDTLADARTLIDPASSKDRKSPEAAGYTVAPVLVHDLRFTLNAARPAALSKDITREGILADALGNYTTTLGTHTLNIAYTGPLLSDHLVESVRQGIARPANIAPRAVTVSPRSTTGAGVDMTREPAPAPEIIPSSPGHHGAIDDHSTTRDPVAAAAVGTSTSHSQLWADLLAAAIVLLIFLTVVRLLSMTLTKSAEDN